MAKASWAMNSIGTASSKYHTQRFVHCLARTSSSIRALGNIQFVSGSTFSDSD